MLTLARHPRSTLFPYTTLFRSDHREPRTRDRAEPSTHVRRASWTGREPSDRPEREAQLAPGNRGRDRTSPGRGRKRSEEHTSELQSPCNLVCRLLLEKKKKQVI